ncbi:MAG TPA: UvrD-helicase domain-containing protein [Candidatus Saccharimonadales bacterium]|nr:UvrD-helicase domain-containing protein [Candidatus Saccharimonadales bacterium]
MPNPQEDLFQGLNPQQIPAVTHLNGPALVVAGPGSGKTRVLTHRVAYLIKNCGVSELSILCVTFTNKAAGEIKSRVENLLKDDAIKLPWSGTFHSICSKILRKDGFNIGIPISFVIYDSDDQQSIIKGILKDFGIDPKKTNPYAVLSTISGAKSELIFPEDYEKIANGYFQRTVAKIYPEYQKRLRANDALDFDDLLVETVKLFTEVPQVLQKYQRVFQYIMVDEYQDTNKAQYVLTKLLADDHKNLFVVGDMAQAIYSFRGADFRNILNFQRDYPYAIIYNLEQNYRSTQTILNAATNVIKNNSTHIPLDLWTQNGKGEKIITYTGNSEKEEAAFVATQLLEEISHGKDFKDIAVLYRTNAQSRNIEEFFIRNNIPYKIIGGQRFYSRKEIKDVIAYLRVVHNPKDSVSWDRIINTPPRGIGDKSREALKANKWNIDEVEHKTQLPFSKWIGEKEKYSTLELMDELIEASRYLYWLNDGTEENKMRIENVKELRTVAAQFTNLEEFLENVALIESSDKPRNADFNAVTLLTIHASKGLEYKVIFIIGMEEGLFPHQQSLLDLNELEEERRLCYVAITRAMEKVYLTQASSRMYFGSVQSNMPSRFLAEIPQELIEFRGYMRPRSTFSRQNDEFLDDLDSRRKNFSWD